MFKCLNVSFFQTNTCTRKTSKSLLFINFQIMVFCRYQLIQICLVNFFVCLRPLLVFLVDGQLQLMKNEICDFSMLALFILMRSPWLNGQLEISYVHFSNKKWSIVNSPFFCKFVPLNYRIFLKKYRLNIIVLIDSISSIYAILENSFIHHLSSSMNALSSLFLYM